MLTISTFNVQNDIKKYSKTKTELIIEYLKMRKIDILSLQEVYSKLDRDLKKKLYPSFSLSGKYRFFFKRLLVSINEKTPIITNHKVIYSKTYHLPFLPSLLKRVMTKIVIEKNGQLISIYNTHLDVKYESVKEKQLKKILSILKKDQNPMILMGDFNLKTNKKIFLDFIEELKKIEMKHVDIHEKTFKASQYHRAIDHIFVSKKFKVIHKELITNIPISDHYPVLVQLEYK